MPKGVRLGGRQKGTPNKTTADVRELFAELARLNVPKLQAWIDEIAETDKVRAAELLLRAVEYHIAKQRAPVEVTGKDGALLSVSIDLGAK